MSLGDFGYKEWLSRDSLRPIRSKHQKIPWTAVKCQLVNIIPVSGDNWPQETCEVLFKLISGNKCFLTQKVFFSWWNMYLYMSADFGRRAFSYICPVSTRMGDRIKVQLLLREIHHSLTTHPGQLSLAIPPCIGALSTDQRAVMLCDWGVKAGMARVWWQVKLCDPLYNTCHTWAV